MTLFAAAHAVFLLRFFACATVSRSYNSLFVCSTDAKEAFKLFDKKGEGLVPMKELYNVFKSLALQVENDKLKNWADEQDEDGKKTIERLKQKSQYHLSQL